MGQTEQLVNLLAVRVDVNRAYLVDHYQRVLHASLFLNRAELRPIQVKGIASDEVEALLGFLQQSSFSGADRGALLYQTGLSGQVVLRLGQVLRQFFLLHLENGQIAPMLEIVEAYQEAVILGFIKALEKNIFIEQERTHQALQRANTQD